MGISSLFLSFFLLAFLRHIFMFGNEVGWFRRDMGHSSIVSIGYTFDFYTHSTPILEKLIPLFISILTFASE